MLNVLQAVGLFIGLSAIAIMVWSAAVPHRRIWPPKDYTRLSAVLVWVPTIALCAIIAVLGVWGWGQMAWPGWLRFGVGGLLMLLGNLAIWPEVAKFGIKKTGGAHDGLRTEGLYRYSRNPQYVADVLIVVGWILVCASQVALSVAVVTVVLLLLAPLAEEPWLKEQYGNAYAAYTDRVRRYL